MTGHQEAIAVSALIDRQNDSFGFALKMLAALGRGEVRGAELFTLYLFDACEALDTEEALTRLLRDVRAGFQ